MERLAELNPSASNQRVSLGRTGCTLPLCAARKEERCLNPLGHRRVITSECWYRGRGSNSTAPLCRRGALNQKATPAFLAVGAGFEPAHKLGNSQLPCHLATPQKLVGGQIWSERLESNRLSSLGPKCSVR